MSLFFGLDAADTTSVVAQRASILSAGLSFVLLYLKWVSASQIALLHDANLAVGLIHETTAQRALQGYSAGQTDGTLVETQLQALGAPLSVSPFLTVDFSAGSSDLPSISAYARGFVSALPPGRSFGVYADGTVQTALLAQHSEVPWLAGALSWGGSREFNTSGAWVLKQGTPTQGPSQQFGLSWPSFSGLSYDPDLAKTLEGWAWLPLSSTSKPDTLTGAASSSPAPLPPLLSAQRALQTLDLYHGDLDGIWGPLSSAAFGAFYSLSSSAQEGGAK